MSDVTKCLKSGFNFHTGVGTRICFVFNCIKIQSEAVFA